MFYDNKFTKLNKKKAIIEKIELKSDKSTI